MTRLNLLFGLLLLTLSCNSQTTKKKPTTIKTQATTKSVKLEFLSYSFGDLPHYMFKDIATGQEMEVEFDNNEAGYKIAKDEIDRTCNDEGNCKMSGVKYDATLQFKLVDIYDWNGEEAVKTGKKEKRWILTKLTKTKSNVGKEQTINNTSGKVLVGKILVSEMAGQAYYRILVKPEGSSIFPPDEIEFYMSYNDWEKVKVFKNGKLITIIPGIDEILIEGKKIKVMVRENDSRDAPYTPLTITILN